MVNWKETLGNRKMMQETQAIKIDRLNGNGGIEKEGKSGSIRYLEMSIVSYQKIVCLFSRRECV